MSIVYLFGINIIRRTSLSGRVSNSILLGKQYSLVQTRRLIASSCNFPSSLLGFLWPLAAFAYLVSLGQMCQICGLVFQPNFRSLHSRILSSKRDKSSRKKGAKSMPKLERKSFCLDQVLTTHQNTSNFVVHLNYTRTPPKYLRSNFQNQDTMKATVVLP